MEAQSDKLSQCYSQLQRTDLVTKGVLNPDTLAEFKQVLDSARDWQEGKSLVRYFYGVNNNNFVRFLHMNGLQHFLLLTDGYPIARELNIHRLVTIRWNRESCGFDVVPYENTRREGRLGKNKYNKAAREAFKTKAAKASKTMPTHVDWADEIA